MRELVSCIMPTRNRRRFVGQALAYFLRQDYPNTELVVVDDGEDAIGDLLPADRRIRYIALDTPHTVGAKRNIACAASRGALIAHWDDDDWMAPDRLSIQVAALQRSGAAVTGARDLLYYRLHAGEAWLYRGSTVNERAWPVGATLLYRRSTWEAQPFPDVGVGEDSALLAALEASEIHSTGEAHLIVGLLHSHNAAPKHLDDPAWERRPLDEVAQRIGADRAFYVALRTASDRTTYAALRTASDRTTYAALRTGSDRTFYAALRTGQTFAHATANARTPVTLVADFDVTTGYGSMAEYLAVGLQRAGADVRLAPLSLQPEGVSPEFEALQTGRPGETGPHLYFSWPRPALDDLTSDELFVNTMWESSALPADWPAALNRARAVIVPSRFVADVCRASGVHVPIEVIPEGVDPALYAFQERPIDRPLTTLIVATSEPRKHLQESIAAWQRAFADDPEARLVVKTNQAHSTHDPRIQFRAEPERQRGIAHLYAEADVLLALGNEGFGLPLVEAMATGLPVIALHTEGQADTCADAGDRIIQTAPVGYEPHVSETFGACGVRAVPDVAAVAERLQWVAAHRREAQAIGRAASAWATTSRSIWAKPPAVLDVLERYSRTPHVRRPFRLWVNSWRTACGIAEYTRYLHDAMPPATGVRVVAEAPDVASTRVLHVQHHFGLYDEAALSRTCAAARQKQVPVVVTEHMVRPEPVRCEESADVLIALSASGARTLRERWPSTRVEHVPHGCPTWFPRRKQRRGRVIGAFGFMASHKGFSAILDVARQDRTLSVVLYSSPGSADDEAQFAAAAQNVRLRREPAFLPVDEIARRLADEADVLVFWYDPVDVGVATISGAVRVGLASGVPVLTSPTSWFDDLAEVTYQPPELEQGVRRLLEDTPLRRHLVEAATAHCHAHSWRRTAERHVALWRSLEN